jgi:hypothetical protein
VSILHDLVDWLRGRRQRDNLAVASFTDAGRFNVDVLLAQIEPHEKERILAQLQELSCACDAWEVGFGDMLQFVKAVHDGGTRTWSECVYEAIVAVRDSGEPFTREARRRSLVKLCHRLDEEDEPQGSAVLDKPNARFLPYRPR